MALANSHTLSMRLLTKNESRNECFVHSSQYSYTHLLLYDLVSLFIFLHRSQYLYTHIIYVHLSTNMLVYILCEAATTRIHLLLCKYALVGLFIRKINILWTAATTRIHLPLYKYDHVGLFIREINVLCTAANTRTHIPQYLCSC